MENKNLGIPGSTVSLPSVGRSEAQRELEKLIERLKRRVDTWSLNTDSARVSVRLGDLRTAVADLERLQGERDEAREKHAICARMVDEQDARAEAAEARGDALRRAAELSREFIRGVIGADVDGDCQACRSPNDYHDDDCIFAIIDAALQSSASADVSTEGSSRLPRDEQSLSAPAEESVKGDSQDVAAIARVIHAAHKSAPYPWWHTDAEHCQVSPHIAKAVLAALASSTSESVTNFPKSSESSPAESSVEAAGPDWESIAEARAEHLKDLAARYSLYGMAIRNAVDALANRGRFGSPDDALERLRQVLATEASAPTLEAWRWRQAELRQMVLAAVRIEDDSEDWEGPCPRPVIAEKGFAVLWNNLYPAPPKAEGVVLHAYDPDRTACDLP